MAAVFASYIFTGVKAREGVVEKVLTHIYFFFFQYQVHNISSYPAYHSIHDTFYYVKNFVDPHFTTHLATARIWASTAFLLAQTPVLPINCSDYAAALNKGVADIQKKHGNALDKEGISLGKYCNTYRQLSL